MRSRFRLVLFKGEPDPLPRRMANAILRRRRRADVDADQSSAGAREPLGPRQVFSSLRVGDWNRLEDGHRRPPDIVTVDTLQVVFPGSHSGKLYSISAYFRLTNCCRHSGECKTSERRARICPVTVLHSRAPEGGYRRPGRPGISMAARHWDRHGRARCSA